MKKLLVFVCMMGLYGPLYAACRDGQCTVKVPFSREGVVTSSRWGTYDANGNWVPMEKPVVGKVHPVLGKVVGIEDMGCGSAKAVFNCDKKPCVPNSPQGKCPVPNPTGRDFPNDVPKTGKEGCEPFYRITTTRIYIDEDGGLHYRLPEPGEDYGVWKNGIPTGAKTLWIRSAGPCKTVRDEFHVLPPNRKP